MLQSSPMSLILVCKRADVTHAAVQLYAVLQERRPWPANEARYPGGSIEGSCAHLLQLVMMYIDRNNHQSPPTTAPFTLANNNTCN